MEIGIISPYNVYPSFGGAVRVFQIAKNLGELGCLVHLFTPEVEEKQIELRNVEIHQIKALAYSHRYPITMPGILVHSLSLLGFITGVEGYKELDVIQSEGLITADHGLLLKGLTRKPAVLDRHGIETVQWYRINKVERRNWRRIRLLEMLACKNFNHILSVSEFDKQLFRDLFSVSPSKITVIPNCADVQHFAPRADDREKIRSQYGLSEEPVILFIGILSWLPNVDAVRTILMEVYPKVKEHLPKAVFMFVGSNPPPWLTKHEISDFIVAGFVNDVAAYINAADVCIVPLRFGTGTRLKILESMACEKPVVSTSLGAEGLDVINGEHIILEDDMAGFTRSIIRLIKDREFAIKLGKNARILVKRKYDWKQATKKLINLYEKLLSV